MGRGRRMTIGAFLAALGQFDGPTANVYLQMVYGALNAAMRRALEAMMLDLAKYDVKPLPFEQKLIDRGVAQGLLKGKRAALLRLVARQKITLTDDELARVDTCDDEATLDRWFDNAFTATSASELFA